MNNPPRPLRPPLAERLRAGLEESLEWVKGNGSAQVTEFVDGERIGPMLMTRGELEARRVVREEQSRLSYNANNDALHIRLRDADVHKREEIENGIILSYDAEGQVVGVDILQASERVQKSVIGEAA